MRGEAQPTVTHSAAISGAGRQRVCMAEQAIVVFDPAASRILLAPDVSYIPPTMVLCLVGVRLPTSQGDHRSMTLVVRPGRRMATSLISAGLAALLTAGTVLASTPVTVGYRDHTYGGGAFRPSADKPQSKLWYTDGSWFAGMFLYQVAPAAPKSEYRIYRHDGAHSWTLTPTVVDTRDTSHADYLWVEATQTGEVQHVRDGP